MKRHYFVVLDLVVRVIPRERFCIFPPRVRGEVWQSGVARQTDFILLQTHRGTELYEVTSSIPVLFITVALKNCGEKTFDADARRSIDS